MILTNRKANKDFAAKAAKKAAIAILAIGLAITFLSNQADAEEADGDDQWSLFGESLTVERMTVVGSRIRLASIPGAASLITEEDLEIYQYDDIHRILRQVPGVYIQEEDGFGLRPNIGIRGTGLNRSTNITLMEDGVLIAPAPYAAPAAYYFPTAGRLQAVELRKGSSSIKFGPRTTGGAINLISTSIPFDLGGQATGRFGSFNHKEFHGNVGGVFDDFGFLLETFQANNTGFKHLPNGGDTGFDIEDYLAKFSLDLSEALGGDQSIEIKIGLTDQTSYETYLGLTDADFAADPFQRYAASANDIFTSRHYQFQATHKIQLSGSADLTTVIYYNNFERDWFKLDDLDFGDGRGRIRPGEVFADPTNPLNVAALAILRGQADSIDDAIQLRHNARSYYSFGVQSILGLQFSTGAARHDLEIGIRYHEDQEDRLQNREKFKMENGALVLTSVDPLGSQGNRVADAKAFAAYVQDEISVGKLIIVPGIRLEVIELSRTDFSTSDPNRLLGPTGFRTNTVTAVIPGVGVVYKMRPELSLIAGVHRGFSPPGPSSANADIEESVNFEGGFRYQKNGLFVEAIVFYNDYSNLLGTCTNSIGCTVGDIGDQFNGGKVKVKGLEFQFRETFDISREVYASLNVIYTLTKATFGSTFSNGFFGSVVAGDELPYLPRHQLTVSTGLHGVKWAADVTMNYVSTSRAEAGSGPIPVLELINSRVLVDLALSYRVHDQVKLFVTFENLFDEVYVAARRPYGARPGKPRAAFAGITATF